MSIKDRLDIFIITFNRAESLEKTFGEILAKDSPIKDFEIKIIDNNSTDNTGQIVKKWMDKFPNLKYIKNKYNINGNANIVKGFYYATKDYVWILADNDHYYWDAWREVEVSISNNVDAIMVANYAWPNLDIMHFLNQGSFLPAVIYKTSNIDDTVMGNMEFNISNMFPHLALLIKLLNHKKEIPIISEPLVVVGDNIDKKIGKHIYTRGFCKDEIHPLQKNMTWDAGFANTIHLIKNPKIRNYITKNRFNGPALNSVGVILRNKFEVYNIACIFSALSFSDKFLYLLKIIYVYSWRYIIYAYKEYFRFGEKKDQYSYRLRIDMFNGLIHIKYKWKNFDYIKLKKEYQNKGIKL